MKLKEARIYAAACGLETDAEAVNNIMGFAMCIFPYESINDELNELILDAKNKGISICPSCRMARIDPCKCYMEEKWKKTQENLEKI